MANVFDVANYILSKADLDEGDGITHLKLQKLLYYVKGFSLVLLNKPIFESSMEAWTHGPVVPEVYQYYSLFGRNVIDNNEKGCSEELTPVEKNLIDNVYEVYGNYSASKLRNLSHTESPWLDAFDNQDKNISDESLRCFFRTLIS